MRETGLAIFRAILSLSFLKISKFFLVIKLICLYKTNKKLNKCHELYNARKENECSVNTLIKYNDRPVCSMGDRIVYRSFE